jgi:hypothetical protein
MEHKITFGPFRMARLAEAVDDRFRQAFYSYLAQAVIPPLDGQIERIEGRVFSHYDQPEFAHLTEVRFRYYYELTLSSRQGVKEAAGEVVYDPTTASWTSSHIKPPSVRTLAEKRKIRALLDSHRFTVQRPAECPQCHAGNVAEIIYGVPHWSEGLVAALKSGEICLGGCWAWDESLQWHCLSCKHEWGLTRYALALREIEAKERRD